MFKVYIDILLYNFDEIIHILHEVIYYINSFNVWVALSFMI